MISCMVRAWVSEIMINKSLIVSKQVPVINNVVQLSQLTSNRLLWHVTEQSGWFHGSRMSGLSHES